MADEKTVTYKSHKSRSEFSVKGTPTRAYLAVSGDAATNQKVMKQIGDVRKGSYDFATVDWMARQLKEIY